MIDISGHLRQQKRECGFEDKENYISVNCCGYQKFRTKNFTRFRKAGRLDHQIIYVTKGSGHFKINNEMTCVGEGNIITYKPHDEQYYTYYFSDSTEVYWVHFTGFGSEDVMAKTGLDKASVFYLGISNTCIDLYKKIMYELQIKRSAYEDISCAYFQELIGQITRRLMEISKNVNRTKDANLQKVIEIIHNNYNINNSLDYYSKACNLSKYRFIHNFKALTGMSPMEYVTSLRIDKSKELLISSSLNISEISDVVGYENPLYFSRVFKNATKMSPSKYRKTF